MRGAKNITTSLGDTAAGIEEAYLMGGSMGNQNRAIAANAGHRWFSYIEGGGNSDNGIKGIAPDCGMDWPTAVAWGSAVLTIPW